MVGQDLGARLVCIPSGTLQTTFPAAGRCLSRDISKYLEAGNSKSAKGVPLESLGQARSAGTLQMSVSALVELQWGKTGKPVFRL